MAISNDYVKKLSIKTIVNKNDSNAGAESDEEEMGENKED